MDNSSIQYIVVLVTASSTEEAQKISEKLVKEKLIACVNIVSNIESIFRWKNKVYSEEEVLLIMKSRLELFEEIKDRVISLHSYKVPEIIALAVIGGFEEYLEWLKESTE